MSPRQAAYDRATIKITQYWGVLREDIMIEQIVPIRTPKAIEHFCQSHLELGPCHHALLIMLNGKSTVEQLQQWYHTLGNIVLMIEDLHEAGLVELLSKNSTHSDQNQDFETTKARIFEYIELEIGQDAQLIKPKLDSCAGKSDLTSFLNVYTLILRKCAGQEAVDRLRGSFGAYFNTH